MTIYRPDGTVLLDVPVDDDSYRFVELMGRDELLLKFSLTDFVDIPLGSYCVPDFVQPAARYEVMLPSSVSVISRRNFEYSVTFESSFGHLKKYRIHNMVDGRLRFDLTATPREHLELIVRNLQERAPHFGWETGLCIDESERLISYNHSTCEDALRTLADTFDTEFEIKGGTISLHEVSYNAGADALPLAYGCGNGFRSGVSRTNFNDSLPVERLFVQGGSRNINRKVYAADADGANGSSTLLLPTDGTRIKFDGSSYMHPDDEGYTTFQGREYMVANDRKSVIRADKDMSTGNEDSLDLSEVYPRRVGRVSRVRYIYRGGSYRFDELPEEVRNGDWDSSPLDAINVDVYDSDAGIPDYEACRIAGEQMTVVFQSGMLAGRELNVARFVREEGAVAVGRMEIQRQEIDGILMPGNVFRIKGDEDNGDGRGDEYVVFHCSMPDSYYRAAENEMLEKAVRYLYEHEDVMFSFQGELDGIYAKRNWDSGDSIGSRIVIGGHVAFRDRDIIGAEQSFDTRIESIRQYINNPKSPTVTLSNERRSVSVASALKRIDSEGVHLEELYNDSILFTRRSFRQSQETMQMLAEAFRKEFSEGIGPVTVNTMQMLVGSESLQFKVYDTDFVMEKPLPVSIDGDRLSVSPCGIRHYTLGIDDAAITTSQGRDLSSYMRWTFGSQELDASDDSRAYYLYARVTEASEGAASFTLSEVPVGLEEEDGFYHLLAGIVSSASEGSRSFAPLYGYTEILPNRILTGTVRSADGSTVFDLETGVLSLNSLSGISGARDALKGDRSIASWWGGPMVDRETLLEGEDAGNAASALVRFDGTGYFARGLFSWNIDGSGKVAGGNLSWDREGNITLSKNVTIGGTAEETLDSILTQLAQLTNWFRMDKDGNVYTVYNFYSQKQVSAFGAGGSAGAGGSGDGGGLSRADTWEQASLDNGLAVGARLGLELRSDLDSLDSDVSVLGTRTDSLEAKVGRLETKDSDKHLTIDVDVPSADWNIVHNLDKRPSVTVVTSANVVVFGDVEYVDSNSLVIHFSREFSGKVILN